MPFERKGPGRILLAAVADIRVSVAGGALLNTSATLLLVSAGALGGLAQALLAANGQVRVPSYDRSTRELDFGFLSDLLIGMVGALASLVVGLAVLNQQFFAGTGTPGTSAGVPLEIPSWIRFMSFGALTGFGSRRLLPALSEKINAAIATEVKDQVDQAKSEVKSEVKDQVKSSEKVLTQQTETAVNVLRASVDGMAATTRMKVEAAPESVESSLMALVDKYDRINEPDYRRRQSLKNQIFSEMSAVCLQAPDQRHFLLSKIQAGGSEAWVLALATEIITRPQLGDGTLLVNVARQVRKFLYVKYQVVNAFYALNLKKLLSELEVNDAIDVINGYLSGADPSLQRNIEATVAYLRSG